MLSIKQEVAEAIEGLPDDCTLEDVQYRLYVIQKVREGLTQIDRGEGISQTEAMKRFDKWLTE